MTNRERGQLAKSVVRYEGALALKRTSGYAARLRPVKPLKDAPSVTVFVTSTNNCYPLELTLRTLAACTKYPNYRIVVGDNQSTDGTAPLLERLSRELPLTLMTDRKHESDWYDQMYRTVESTYWIGLHDDIMFLGRDWLADLITRMEADPELWLLEGQAVPPTPGYIEPVSGSTIDLGEQLSTWIFCARATLRERLPNASFAFHAEEHQRGGRKQCWDVGGKLLRDMTVAGLRHEAMPKSYGRKWHHVGNLSWVEKHDTAPVHKQLKRFQKDQIRRTVLRRWPRPAAAP